MPKAYSYIRFSSPQQRKGDSLRRQLAASEAYARQHKLTLDTTMNLRDLAVSGFHGKNAETGALKVFLDAVETGKVERGSYLLVENLDRLSRNKIGAALKLFLGILEQGIKIVSLMTGEMFDEDSINDTVKLIVALVVMSRAHEESVTKSSRSISTWDRRRAGLAKEKLTKRCPPWLRLADDRKKWTIIPERVKVVKEVYRMAKDGVGIMNIVRQLNKSGIPTFGGSEAWRLTYVFKLLHWRAVIGEFQPRLTRGDKRQPVGEPIKGYFPVIISEADFYAVQEALAYRRVHGRGRSGKSVANLFRGLLKDAKGGGGMHLVQKSRGSVPDRRMVSARAQRGIAGATYKSFSYNTFENAFLLWVAELQARDIMPSDRKASEADKGLIEAQGKLKDVQHRIGKLKKRISADPDLEGLYDVYKGLEEQKKGLHTQVEAMKSVQYRAGEIEALAGAKSITEVMNRTKGDELVGLRTKLRAYIGQMVKEIVVLVFDAKWRNNPYRCIKAQIHFHGDGVRWLFAAVDRQGKPIATTVGPSDTYVLGDVNAEDAEQVAREELFGPLKIARTKSYRVNSVRLKAG